MANALSPAFTLSDRVALITGAASGIGASTAIAFAEAGADLALGWYPADGHDIEPVRRAAEHHGRRVTTVALDVTDTEQVNDFVSQTAEAFGQLDIVVANAGIARKVPAAQLNDEAWNQVLDVDLNGVWRCFRAALPHMQKAGFGRLLATSSVMGTVSGWPGHAHYSAAKAALTGLVKSLAVECGPDGITANAIAPGLIRTPQALDPLNSLGPELMEQAIAQIPVGRVGTPEDIASAFRFLASEAAGYISGQLITIDGARHLAVRD